MSAVHYDFETTSLADLQAVGGYRYAVDPSTRILMFAIADETGDPVLWRFDQPDSHESRTAKVMLEWAIDEDYLVYAHNYQFELAIAHHRLAADVGIPKPPAHLNLRCTQAMCRRAAIPESLGKAAEFLKLDQQKETVGKALIKIFSDQMEIVTLEPPLGAIDPDSLKPLKKGGFTKGKKPKNLKSASPILDSPVLWDWRVRLPDKVTVTVREAWEMFCAYCKQDVIVEREVHRKLKRFELTGDELASFQFDLRFNFRGTPFNVAALVNAQKIITEYQDRLEARMQGMCGLRSGQGKALLVWLRARGYTEDNLQADTVEKVLAAPGAMTPLAVEVLRHRALLSFASIKKIPTILGAVCPDGRVRGTKTWHGARTGRGTSKLVQMDNLKKATIKDSGLAYSLICAGDGLDWIEELWESPLEVLASCTRHFAQLPNGQKMLDADFIGVEARIAAWLSGEVEKLQSILDGVDQYKTMAAEIVFNIPYDQVTRAQRTIGKPVELSCVYGTGGEGLRDSLRNTYHVQQFIDMEDKAALIKCNAIVKAYRAKFHRLVQCWRDMEDAAKKAIRSGETTHVADGRISFGKARYAGIDYLVMRLPSGRCMYYPRPEIKSVFKKYTEEDMEVEPWKREKGGYWTDSISFYGKHEQVWGRIHTWGSRLFENASQAIGADLLNYGMISAERAGYKLVMSVHDQALAEQGEGDTIEGFIEALCQKQPWAATFPLEADGAVVPYYLKED